MDSYGRSLIRSIYYDTDTWRIVRRSLEKPLYKEKLRIRSYSAAWPGDPVFVELKKKYDSLVFKRRISVQRQEAEAFLAGEPVEIQNCPEQIINEISYFRDHYGPIHPAVIIFCERTAYCLPLSDCADTGLMRKSYDTYDTDLRVTFDEHVLGRTGSLCMDAPVYGTPLLDESLILMEIKTRNSVPAWLSGCLSKNKIFHTSFSKYGSVYEKMIRKNGI